MAKPNKISGQFAARLIEMMESPAYRVLSLSAHRVLSRIEVEWAHHGGQDNGQLPVTFDDFVEYGLHRTAIGPALTELEDLGFIIVTDRGKMAHAADYRRPKKFLLTSRPTNKGADPLHNWKRFKTMEEAQAIAEGARQLSGEKKKEPVRKPCQKPVRKTYQKGEIASTETVPLRMSETVPLSISRVGTPSEIGNLATHDHPEATRPSRFRSRRAGALSFERWGQVKPDPVKPDPAPAKRPRRAGGLSQARWRITPDAASNSQRPLVVEALPPNEELPSNAQRADSAPRMVDVSAPQAPTSPLVN